MEHNGILLVMFDLPMKLPEDRKKYRYFIKFLKSNGYVRIQESVFVKLQRNTQSLPFDIKSLTANSPKSGQVMALPLTVNQFSKIKAVQGEMFDVHFIVDDIIVTKSLDKA